MSKVLLDAVPSFYLYGDEQQDVDLDSLHCEPIRDRSGRNDWTIHPHIHPDHTQVLWISEGGAEFQIEDVRYVAQSNSLVVQPAGMFHEIRFRPDCEGRVLTASVSCINQLVGDDSRLLEITRRPGCYSLKDERQIANIRHGMDELISEVNSSNVGRRAAMRTNCMLILVALLRASASEAEFDLVHQDRDYELVMGYREALETHFRRHKSVAYYASLLAVSEKRLNKACKARAGKTASETLYERILTEAKRCLRYTEMTVAEIAYFIGYEDPAYFNRFFSQRVGKSPGVYRTSMATTRRINTDG